MIATSAGLDSRVAEHLRENIITARTFHLLKEDVKRAILGDLPNREIAAWCAGLDDVSRADVLGLERREL